MDETITSINTISKVTGAIGNRLVKRYSIGNSTDSHINQDWFVSSTPKSRSNDTTLVGKQMTCETSTASEAAQSNLTSSSIHSVANADCEPEEEQQQTPKELTSDLILFDNEDDNRSSLTVLTPLSTGFITADSSNIICFTPCAAVEATPDTDQRTRGGSQASSRTASTESKRIQLFFVLFFQPKNLKMNNFSVVSGPTVVC
jgi:hypothetical protein